MAFILGHLFWWNQSQLRQGNSMPCTQHQHRMGVNRQGARAIRLLYWSGQDGSEVQMDVDYLLGHYCR